LLPIRLLIALVCLTLSTCLAYIGLYNLKVDEIDAKPFTNWRLFIRKMLCAILRFMFFACGFFHVKIKGKQAGPDEARILAVAPHSSFFDALAVVIMGAPSVVAKAETSAIPFWGSLIKYTQPVLVHRNDPNSRQNTIRQIVARSNQADDWQQVLIFPEGTCTNRSSFIPFRPGAFLPGVPIQPVILRYENMMDTVTWTWEGLPAWKVIVYSLSQFYVSFSIEFLEPYVPGEKEVQNPTLFANNVRSVMAARLGITSTDCSYFDYLRIEKSQRRGKALQKLQRKLEEPLLQTTSYIEELTEENATIAFTDLDIHDRIGLSKDAPELAAVIGHDNEADKVDLRHFRLSILVCDSQNSLQCFLDYAFLLFDKCHGAQRISSSVCLDILKTHLFLSSKEAQEAIKQISKEDDVVEREYFENFITVTKPNHKKVIRAMEGRLNAGMTDLLAASASLTAERMAAKLEKVAASGSILVSDMSATVAAGRDKVSDVFSSAVTSLHKRTDSYSDKKKE